MLHDLCPRQANVPEIEYDCTKSSKLARRDTLKYFSLKERRKISFDGPNIDSFSYHCVLEDLGLKKHLHLIRRDLIRDTTELRRLTLKRKSL